VRNVTRACKIGELSGRLAEWFRKPVSAALVLPPDERDWPNLTDNLISNQLTKIPRQPRFRAGAAQQAVLV
jgi:hypothetical protein